MERWLTIAAAPPGWFSDDELVPTTHLVQPAAIDDLDGQAPPSWLDELGERPVVYVTLGTVVQTSAVFELIFEALGSEPVDLVVTVGPSLDPEPCRTLAPRARIERYVAQSLVLSRAAAAVTHAGYGSLTGALRHGVPVVCLPLGAADNLPNARRVERTQPFSAVLL